MAFLSEDNFFKMWSSLCEAYLPLTLTWVKLNVRPEVSTEPTHFLTLMNNGKAFSSLDGMACTTKCSVLQDTDNPRYWIYWDLKKPNQLI